MEGEGRRKWGEKEVSSFHASKKKKPPFSLSIPKKRGRNPTSLGMKREGETKSGELQQEKGLEFYVVRGESEIF